MLRHACGFALANKGYDTRAVRYTELSPMRFKHFWR
jgi:type 1 fimbriae regulatory protein FimB/type 1 fimbriae regulatory protein FimE